MLRVISRANPLSGVSSPALIGVCVTKQRESTGFGAVVDCFLSAGTQQPTVVNTWSRLDKTTYPGFLTSSP